MKNSWVLALQFSFIGLAPNAFSQALDETTAFLNDAAARNDLAQKDPAAQSATAQVHALGLAPEDEAKVYQLTGKIFEKITQNANGNVIQMNDQVQQLSRDPTSLEKILNEDQKAEIHNLADHRVQYKKAN